MTIFGIVHNSKCKNKHSHPSNQVGKTSPEEEGTAENRNVVQNTCSSSCKPRTNFKKGINKARDLPRKDKGETTKERPKDPTEGNDQDSLLGINPLIFWLL
ncbi:Uncharacterised protein [Streptococcus pneumoniae]|nr:Uncharacterised protein [Streptococcus pneumoniae]